MPSATDQDAAKALAKVPLKDPSKSKPPFLPHAEDVPAYPAPPLLPLVLVQPSDRSLRPIPPSPTPRDFPSSQRWRSELFRFQGASPRMVVGSVSRRGEDTGGEAHKLPKSAEELSQRTCASAWHTLDEGEEALRRAAEQEETLWIVGKRYWRNDLSAEAMRKGVTMVSGVANGMPKESYEPMLAGLLATEASSPETRVVEVWVIEDVPQGDSSYINRDVLGPYYDWSEKSRDLLQFMFRFIPTHPSPNALFDSQPQSFLVPPALPLVGIKDSYIPLNAPLSSRNGMRGAVAGRLASRRFLVFGHSYSSTALIRLASEDIFHDLAFPRHPGVKHPTSGAHNIYPTDPNFRFEQSDPHQLDIAFFLIDPVLCGPHLKQVGRWTKALLNATLARPYRWEAVDGGGFEEARRLAKRQLLQNPFYKRLHSKVLDAYVDAGLVNVGQVKAAVELKTRRQDEALIFGDLYALALRRGYYSMARFPRLLRAHFLTADKKGGLAGSVMEPVTHERARTLFTCTAMAGTWSDWDGVGHMMPHEKPDEVAGEIRGKIEDWWGARASAKRTGESKL